MSFFSAERPAIKICGVTLQSDAEKLIERGVEALGLNFWEKSKRYCSPEHAGTFSPGLRGRILRVGVFVNARTEDVLRCFQEDLIDVAQFHGDESESYLREFSKHHLPFIKALSLNASGGKMIDPPLSSYSTQTLLLDAHAPGVYGGTGKTIDWQSAGAVVKNNPDYQIILAGGITPENAREAAEEVRPYALDIASGAESSPGVKDFEKIERLQKALASYVY